ncbi:unnamed protein product [Sphagnum balticum]
MVLLENDHMGRLVHIMDVFAVDPIAFIETFGWIKIPNYNNAVKPFFLFDYQKEVIIKLMNSENDNLEHEILVDKIREMGLTWTIVWYIIWRWLFTKGWSAFIMSRTENEVDDGTVNPDNSIFGKIRWGIQRLPVWIKPESFKPKGRKGTSTDMMLRIMNPAMETSINGSTTNANAGRSRRFSFIFMDEAFYVENFGSVYASIQSVARVKVFVSTSRAGFIYKSLKDLAEKNHDYISLSWKDNPFKDQIWYDSMLERAKVDDSVMKELEVSYAVSGKTQYYPEMASARMEVCEYNPLLPLYVALDFGTQDKTVILYIQYDGKNVRVVDAYANSQKPLEWYLPFLNWTLFVAQSGRPVPDMEINPDRYNQAQKEILNRISHWKKPKAYFGEVAHFQRVMPLNSSVAQELAKYGPESNKVRLLANKNAMKHEPRRAATVELIPHTIFNSKSPYVMELFDALQNSRYSNSIRSTSQDAAKKPVHDPSISDYRSAFENFCVNAPRTFRVSQRDTTTRTNDPHRVNSFVKMAKYLKI